MVMTKDVFKILEKKYVQNLFERKKNFYFPSLKNKKILKVQIKKKTPDWVKESCLASYKISFSDSTTKVVWATAKIGESKKRAFETLNHLYNKRFNKGFFQVPRPLDYIREPNAFFYQEVKGDSLELLLEKKKLAPVLFKRLAEFLFQIHSLDFKGIKARTLGIKDYKECFEELKKLTPSCRSLPPPLKKITFLEKLNKGDCFVHGDFYPSNIIIGQNKLFLIDFDKAGKGNFLLDLLSFYFWFDLPKIKPLKLSSEEIRKYRDTFLMHYCQLSNLNFPEIKAQLKKFKIKIFLNCLHYVTFRALRGWRQIDQNLRSEFTKTFKILLKKINQSF